MSRKLLIIGVDALDAVQIERFTPYLPNISHLRKAGFYSQLSSVWPPDSETAWASIYTGLNPARHGVFQFVDPLQKTSSYVAKERDNSVLRGLTFWDYASRAKRRVCILFPHIGYPSWPVNGLMVTRSSLDSNISLTPRNMEDKYSLRGLSGVKGLAGRNRGDYLEANRGLVNRQLEFTLQVMEGEQWDLLFTYWSALDLIQHQFWALCDPEDPYFQHRSPYRNTIRDFYILHDRVIGKLLAKADSNTTVIVMSDHGHGMRPVKIFNINRLLRDNGLLALRHSSKNKQVGALKRLKRYSTNIISRYDLGDVAAKVLKHAPWTKQFYLSTADLDFDRTIAYITDMSGIKAYSYGGIQIARRNLNGISYERVREKIIDLLYAARDPISGERTLVKWVKPREELYEGPHLSEYPDLVFELGQEYGAGWEAAGPLFDVSHAHSLYPGSHIGANAVFMLSGPDAMRIDHAPSSLMDIAPTVLDVLNVSILDTLDGESILNHISSV